MDNWEDKLAGLFNDPEKLSSLLSLVSSFGLAPEQKPKEPPVPAAPDSAPDRIEMLLTALRPFVSPGRREKMDRAIQAARLTRIAGRTLRGPRTDSQ